MLMIDDVPSHTHPNMWWFENESNSSMFLGKWMPRWKRLSVSSPSCLPVLTDVTWAMTRISHAAKVTAESLNSQRSVRTCKDRWKSLLASGGPLEKQKKNIKKNCCFCGRFRIPRAIEIMWGVFGWYKVILQKSKVRSSASPSKQEGI